MRKPWRPIVALIALVSLTSCRYAYKVDCDPPDAAIMADGVPLKPGVRTYLKSRETLVEAR